MRKSIALKATFAQWLLVLNTNRIAARNNRHAVRIRFLIWKRFAQLQALKQMQRRRLDSRFVRRAFTEWRKASLLELHFNLTTAQFHQARDMLRMRIAVRLLSQFSQRRRLIRSQSEICQTVSHRSLQKAAISRLIHHKNRNVRHDFICTVLNYRFLKKVLFQRYAGVLCYEC
jgi:hypothetical protein